MMELLERSTRAPSRLYSSPLPPRHSPAIRASSPKRPFTPSPLQMFSSVHPLEIREVQFSSQESREESHTSRLTAQDCNTILRRGNTLVLKIVTLLELTCGYAVTLTFVPALGPRKRFAHFRANGVGRGTKDLWFSISIPANFPIGKYHAHISLSLKGRTDVITHFHHRPLVVLFNPWNPEDDTYMESAEDLQHYLLEDVGTIWRGTSSHPLPTKWEFGQYEPHCLDVALHILKSLDVDERRSATTIARGVVSHVNTRDNSGVMAGSFTGSYGGGVHPCRWNGSPAILQRFHRSKTPVRFGQCWVFAGVTVTLLRALGIPCRPVTCYEAAHFSKKLRQSERCFTPEGDLLHDSTSDQIWVYHVWCEAWMRRDDLPLGYEGWQVVDATPQDKQSGRFRIGPVPVRAVQEGKAGRKWAYDCEYVTSEVGSDVRYLRVTQNCASTTVKTVSVAQVRSNETGSLILTSAGSGSDSRLDVTSSYKQIEQTSDRQWSSSFPPPSKDCSFSVVMSEGVRVGESVEVRVDIRNEGAMLRTVDGRVVGRVVLYTGRVVRNLLSMEFSGVVSPGQNASVSLPVESRKYLKLLAEQGILQFFIAVKVRESKQLYLKVHNLQVVPPQLEVDCPRSLVRGRVTRVRLRFRNVLSYSLSRVLFMVQAQALCPQRELSHKRLVLPGALVEVEFPLRPQAVGRFTLLASMHCDQLTDVRGWTEIRVADRGDEGGNHR